jgi:hypothetical protein
LDAVRGDEESGGDVLTKNGLDCLKQRQIITCRSGEVEGEIRVEVRINIISNDYK